MRTNYLFDVDGTLTPPRGEMDKDFRRFFVGKWVGVQYIQNNGTYLVTGSDRDKTVEQVGQQIWRAVDGVFQNCGNQLYEHGSLVRESSWKMSRDLKIDLLDEITKSRWYGTASNNIEERIGMVNISTIGRNVPHPLRKEYYEWDNENLERKGIVERLSEKHPDIEFNIGGEISIDVHPVGCDKSQALEQIGAGRTIFFGDKCTLGGNDCIICLKADVCHMISGWEETYEIMKRYC